MGAASSATLSFKTSYTIGNLSSMVISMEYGRLTAFSDNIPNVLADLGHVSCENYGLISMDKVTMNFHWLSQYQLALHKPIKGSGK